MISARAMKLVFKVCGTQLTSITLRYATQLDDQSVKSLLSYCSTSLTSLNLSGASNITQLPTNLPTTCRSITLCDCAQLTFSSLEAFGKACGAQVTHLSLGGNTNLPDAVGDVISQYFTNLETLEFAKVSDLKDNTVLCGSIRTLMLMNAQRLVTLDLTGVKNLTNNTLISITKAGTFSYIRVSACNVNKCCIASFLSFFIFPLPFFVCVCVCVCVCADYLVHV